MGLIEQEIMELRNLAKGVMDGSINDTKASLLLGVYNQTSKRVSQMIQIASIQAKEGKNGKMHSKMVGMNIISGDAAIQISNTTPEMVKCPEQGGLCITRHDCLDYSGMSYHIDDCQKCEQFSTTRKQLSPKV